jgi:hypothetical protein
VPAPTMYGYWRRTRRLGTRRRPASTRADWDNSRRGLIEDSRASTCARLRLDIDYEATHSRPMRRSFRPASRNLGRGVF